MLAKHAMLRGCRCKVTGFQTIAVYVVSRLVITTLNHKRSFVWHIDVDMSRGETGKSA